MAEIRILASFTLFSLSAKSENSDLLLTLTFAAILRQTLADKQDKNEDVLGLAMSMERGGSLFSFLAFVLFLPQYHLFLAPEFSARDRSIVRIRHDRSTM